MKTCGLDSFFFLSFLFLFLSWFLCASSSTASFSDLGALSIQACIYASDIALQYEGRSYWNNIEVPAEYVKYFEEPDNPRSMPQRIQRYVNKMKRIEVRSLAGADPLLLDLEVIQSRSLCANLRDL